MGRHGVHSPRPLLHTRLDGLTHRARRADHVVHHNGHAPVYRSDQRPSRHLFIIPHLLNERRRHLAIEDGPQSLGKLSGSLHPPLVRRHHDHLLIPNHIFQSMHKQGMAQQMLGRRPEGILKNGKVVYVHCEDAVDPHGLEQSSHVAGGDRSAGTGLAVFALVAEVRNNRRHALGRGVVQGPEHEEEAAQLVVYTPRVVRVERLNDEGVAPPHVHLWAHLVLPVREGLLVVGIELRVECRGDGLAKGLALGECKKAKVIGHKGNRNSSGTMRRATLGPPSGPAGRARRPTECRRCRAAPDGWPARRRPC